MLLINSCVPRFVPLMFGASDNIRMNSISYVLIMVKNYVCAKFHPNPYTSFSNLRIYNISRTVGSKLVGFCYLNDLRSFSTHLATGTANRTVARYALRLRHV